MNYEVFISFKNSFNGSQTEDATIAAKLYEALEKKQIHSFYSNTRLFEFGEAAYKEAIENALEQAKVLVVIATDAEYLKTRWVSYERESFHDDILSGRKKDAVIVPYMKNVSGIDVPRSLRSYETFQIDVNDIQTVVAFIEKCLAKTKTISEAKCEKSIVTGKSISSYDPAANKEFRRLKIQANNTHDADMPAIEYVIKKLNKPNLCILDAGCAYGYVTNDRFGKLDTSKVLAVDINEKCLEFAREHNNDNNVFYEHLDLENENFEDELELLMNKYQIEKIDIVFSSLVLHHLKNPNKFLRRIRKYLCTDGFIIVRGSDDGSIMTYNDDGLIEKIVNMNLKTDGISDRLNGRKIYSQLISSGYKNVKMMNYIKDLSGLDLDERYNVFLERFSYRRNYLQRELDKDPYNMEKRSALEAMDFALDKLENKFGEETFWYCETDFIGVAQKR